MSFMLNRISGNATSKRFLLLLLLILLGMTTGCAKSPTGRNQLMLVSPETAISASKEAYVSTIQSLNDEGKIDNDPVTTQKVKTITGRIVHQTIELYPYTENWEWSIKVIDDPEMVNAWCMAGGKMAVYSGLLKKVEPTDDELAQVIAHEISHAIANHTAEKMSMAMAYQVGITGVTMALTENKYKGLAVTGTALAANLAIKLPNSREAEEEADRIGIELAARAGYDPRAAVTLWEKMGKVGGSRVPEFLSTHPSPDNRQETLSQLGPEMMPFYEGEKKKNHLIYQF